MTDDGCRRRHKLHIGRAGQYWLHCQLPAGHAGDHTHVSQSGITRSWHYVPGTTVTRHQPKAGA